MDLSRARLHAAATAAHDDLAGSGAGPQGLANVVAASRRLVARIEAEFAGSAAAGATTACAAGCSYCCHQRVGILPHEALALAGWLQQQLPPELATAITARIRANAARIDALTPEQHRRANLPCAFLVEGSCSAYPVRPLACASHHSLDRSRCERAFRHPEDAGTPRNARPVLLEMQAMGEAMFAAARSANDAVGLAGPAGELHQMVRSLLDAGSGSFQPEPPAGTRR
jgi:Fe-S-cluster containining protein